MKFPFPSVLRDSLSTGSCGVCSALVARASSGQTTLKHKKWHHYPGRRTERKKPFVRVPLLRVVEAEVEEKGMEEPRIPRDLKLNTVASLGLETVSRKRNYKARKAGGGEAFWS